MMSNGSPRKPGKVHQISAVSNVRIKAIKALAQKKYRDESGTFLVEGQKLVRDAFDNGWEIETLIYASASEVSAQLNELAAQVRVSGADILEVTEKILTSISRRDNPQMVSAVIKQKWQLPPAKLADASTVWIALDRVRDPGNLGTIIRTADAAGVSGIILVGETTDPFSMEASRATMGSLFNIALVKQTEEEFLDWCRNWPGIMVGTHLEGATDFRTIDYASKPVLLLMGNEQQGLPQSLADACDKLALIPMHGSADSLNLAIATGVMLFQMGKGLPTVERADQ